jgi:hypothetical protein
MSELDVVIPADFFAAVTGSGAPPGGALVFDLQAATASSAIAITGYRMCLDLNAAVPVRNKFR